MSGSDKARLTEVLSKVCALQGQYGKTTAELQILVEGFCWALGDYPMDAIIAAIGQYIKKGRDIPKPADIEAILNPPPPKPDWALYVELKKKSREGYYLLSDERKFVNNCEDLAKLRQQGEVDNYRATQSQLQQHKALAYDTGYEGELE